MKPFTPPPVPEYLPDLPAGTIYLGTKEQCPLRNFAGYGLSHTYAAGNRWIKGTHYSGEIDNWHYAALPEILEEHGYTVTTEAERTLPEGAVYLGLGGTFKMNGPFEGWMNNGSPGTIWTRHHTITGGVCRSMHYAAPADSPIAKLNNLTKEHDMNERELYLESQERWVRDNNIRPGDKVKILRSFKDHEMGLRNSCNKHMERMIGTTCTVHEVGDKHGVKLHEGYRWPWFVLEKIEPEVPKFPLDRIGHHDINYDGFHDTFRFGCQAIKHADVKAFVCAYNEWRNE